MPMLAKEIEQLLLESFPNAKIKIEDLRGDGDHYAAYIETKEFIGEFDDELTNGLLSTFK